MSRSAETRRQGGRPIAPKVGTGCHSPRCSEYAGLDDGASDVRPQQTPLVTARVPLIVVSDVRLHRESIVSALSCCDRFDVAGSTAVTIEDLINQIDSRGAAIVVLDMVTHASRDIAAAI